jgi:Protein of unknown function (DUF2786)
VGKASRLRHRAKEQNRAKERARRQHDERQAAGPGRRPPPAGRLSAADRLSALAEQLATDAVNARLREDTDTFERCAAQLADGPGTPEWQRIVDQYLHASLLHEVTTGWRQGWQPAELVRHMSRMADDWHARMATDLIGAELHRYAAATIDERWNAQLTELGVKLRPLDAGYLEHWADRAGTGRAAAVRCALEVLYILAALPELARLAPLPGAARSGALAPGRAHPHPADQRMLGRVRALLAKAESTEFAAEAEALTARAQELMARHSIDYALLAAASGSTDAPSGRRLFLENPYEAPKALLLDVVAAANRSRAVWHRSLGLGTVLGFPADLDAVELLFTSLLVQATTAMMHAGARRDAYGRSRTRSFRQSFLTSYAQRIGERLADSAGVAQQQAAAESPGTDLVPVLAARDSAVDQAADEMFPELTKRSVTSGSDREGWLRGRAAADLAPLHGRREVTGDLA